MKDIGPKFSDTQLGNHPWEWIPKNFDNFLQELNEIISRCKEMNHLLLFRGHRDRRWLLDSTFVRSYKTLIFGIQPWEKLRENFRLSTTLQQIVLNLFLFKFGGWTIPSDDLCAIAEREGVDPWFELMKRLQQFPEIDTLPVKGTFLIDWTQNPDVALHFANDLRQGDGVLWICDATATGKTLHRDITVGEILEKMKVGGSTDSSMGAPLIFHPRKQIGYKRASNQNPVYVAQMDLRVDLIEVWNNLQNERERILIKLVLPAETTEECQIYLKKNGIDRNLLFPA